ncbi:helix-turn-helix transcriptional regulator [Hydrogenimonas sp.]
MATDYSVTLKRLYDILRRMDGGQAVDTSELADEFGVSRRTIQKNITFLKEHFPLESAGRGRYRLKAGYSLKGTGLDEEEMLVLLFALKPLESAPHLSDIKEKIVRKSVDHAMKKTPIVLKGEGFEDLDLEQRRHRLLEAIEKRRVVVLIEENDDETEVEPYKILNFEGLWYLFGRDVARGRLDVWQLADIVEVQHTHASFHVDDEAIEARIETEVNSPWFEDGKRFEVRVRVGPRAADAFLLKKVLPTQRVVARDTEGGAELSFEVTHVEDIDNAIKAWLPDVEVLAPEWYRERFLRELREYLRRMEG